jgi:hypothetical protein
MLLTDHTYYWRVDANNGSIRKGIVWSFKTSPGTLGTIKMDIWEDMGAGGNVITKLTNDIRYPDSPTTSRNLTSFDTGVPGYTTTNYGAQISGYIYCPKTGNYKFYLCSAGAGQLWLSTDDDPAHLRASPIDQETVWGGLNGYDFSHSSAYIPLEGGKRYYIMARYVSVDWHYCQIAWQGAGIRDREVIRGCYTAPFVYKISRNPYPPNGAVDMETLLTTSWTPGAYHVSHDIYFSTDPNAVRDANRTNPMGVLKKQNYDPCNWNPGILNYETTYYWRIDDVNDPCVFKGNVWHFTTRDISKITFENYIASGDIGGLSTDLRRTWIDGRVGVGAQDWTYPNPPVPQGSSGSYVQLNNDPCDGNTITANVAQAGIRSLKLYYDNDGSIGWLISLYRMSNFFVYTAPMFSEVSAGVDDAALLTDDERYLYPVDQNSLRMMRDWSPYKILKLGYYGALGNTKHNAKDQMYVGLQDGEGDMAIIYNPDTDAVLHQGWHTWYIDLGALAEANPAVQMTNIARIHLGVGNRNAPASGGRGAIFIDELQLLTTSVCAPVNPANIEVTGVTGDFSADCTVNTTDLQRLTRMWLWQASTAPILPDANCVIKLDASTLTVGSTLSAWTNTIVGASSVATTFKDPNALVSGRRPKVQMVEGLKAVVFDGNDELISDVNAPASITGNMPFTVIYKVWNESFGTDEEVFTWGKRGTNNRQAAVCFGDGSNWEAGAMWGGNGTTTGGDITFNTYQPAPHQWHTIIHSYQGGTNGRYYVITDGKDNSNQLRSFNIWPNCPMSVGSAYDGDPYLTKISMLGAGIGPFSGALAEIRIYNVFTDPGALAFSYGAPMNLATGDVPEIINFRDIAVFANNWMTQSLLGN